MTFECMLQIADCEYVIRSIRIVPGSNNDQFNWNNSAGREFLGSLRNSPEITQEEGFYYILGNYIYVYYFKVKVK